MPRGAVHSTLLQFLRRIIPAPDAGAAMDEQLLHRFATTGDESAFAALVQRHGPLVLGVCRRALSDPRDAEDAFQATFLVLVRKAGVIRRPELLGKWLYGVANRVAAKARVRAARRRRREQPLPDGPVAGESRPTAEGLEWRSVLDEEVHRLPVKYRTAVVLCYPEGLTNEEAARRLGCPKGTVQSRLAWGRERLRTRLRRRGVALSLATSAAWLLPQTQAPALPVALADATVQSARLFAAGPSAAGPLPSPAASLAQGVLHAMFLSKLKGILALGLVLVVLGAGAGFWLNRAPAAVAAPDEAPPKGKKDPGSPKNEAKRFKAEEVVSSSFKTGKAPRVVVELFNGDIDLAARAEGTVGVRVTKRAEAEDEAHARDVLRAIEVRMTYEDDTVRVTARRPEGETRSVNAGASAELHVPPGAVLELRTGNGGVRVVGGAGPVTVHSGNGSIDVKDNKGPLHLSTANGSVSARGATGKLELRTENGTVEVEAEKALVNAHCTNGVVGFRGTLAAGSHEFDCVNGGILLTLPPDSRFRLDARTTHGNVVCQFSLGQQASSRKTRLKGSVGDNPSAEIQAHAVNGGIEIRKGK